MIHVNLGAHITVRRYGNISFFFSKTDYSDPWANLLYKNNGEASYNYTGEHKDPVLK